MQFHPYDVSENRLGPDLFEAAKADIHDGAEKGRGSCKVLDHAGPDCIGQALGDASLRKLWLRAPRIEDLGPLAGKGLEALVLTDAPRVKSLSHLAGCRDLRTLIVEDCSRLIDLSGLEMLEGVEVLRLSVSALGGGWKKIDLAPLRCMRRLRHLDLKGIRTPDNSLEIVADLPRLETFSPDGGWPMKELARVAARHPHLKGSFLKPLVASAKAKGSGFFDIDPAMYPPEVISYTVSGARGASNLKPGRDDKKLTAARKRWEGWISDFQKGS